MEIKAIIVDDEERGIIALTQLIERYCTGVLVSGAATNAGTAEQLILKQKPDVVFLDIEMPGGNGFQLLERLDDIGFELIFVTAFNEYALKAIKFSALDYLLKPVKIAELQAAVEKVKKRRADDAASEQQKYAFLKSIIGEPNAFRKIILSTQEGFFPIKFEDIIYCRADDSYTHFYATGNKHHIVSRNLKEFEDMLAPHHFYRIHKSYLINLNHIDKVLKTDGVSVVMSNGEELPVSFRKKDDFFSMIKSFG